MPFGSEGLVVTWVGPAPADGRINITDGRAFDAVSRMMDRSRDPLDQVGFNKRNRDKYFSNLWHSDVFNASMAWDLDTFIAWQKHHGIEMEERPLQIFENYLQEGRALFMALVEHPPVLDADRFTACSIILQRGVIFYNQGRQDLFIRSYFHSSNGDEAVNFVPTGAIQMSFATDAIWFPLALTEGIPEPAAEVVLDIASDQPLSAAAVPEPFKIQDVGRAEYGLQRFAVTRIAASVPSKAEVADLRIEVGAGKRGS